MTKINEIWQKLEHDNSSGIGLLLRRYSPEVLPDVFIGLTKVEKLRCIVVRLDNRNIINLTPYTNLEDIKLEFVPDEKDDSKTLLLILLTNTLHADVFGTLCEDLIWRIADFSDEQKIVKELLNRFEKWKSLFDKASAAGLSKEEQRGLYGELYLLRKYIINSINLSKCIKSWIGPESNVRDFQLDDWAIEVKTTHGNNHQKVHISSERQLDTQNLTSLLLFHLSLEVQQRNGESLNTIKDSIIKLLEADVVTLTQFRTKMLLAGYYDKHRTIYDDAGYQVREESYYLVKDDFPRIEEKDIRNGVGDVKYTIILSEYQSYKVEEQLIFKSIA